MLYFSIIHDEFGSKSSIQVIHLKEDSGWKDTLWMSEVHVWVSERSFSFWSNIQFLNLSTCWHTHSIQLKMGAEDEDECYELTAAANKRT
jgi:hypothetical protein